MEFDRIVRDLVLSNKERIFPNTANSVEIVDVVLGRQQYKWEDRYHRSLIVYYRNNGLSDAVKLWLKFRPGLDQLYPVLVAYHDKLKQQIFPAPYFFGHRPGGDAFLATAYIRGSVLRNRLIWLGVRRQTAQLEPVFRANGAKMRQFHDAFPTSQSIAVDDVVAQATKLTRVTPYFSPNEKKIILALLASSQALLPMTALPAVLTHNDWLLKNIIVTPDGTDYVIDCDSMRHRPNWRWFDIVYMLLNVESQRKWFPLVTARIVCDLWRAFWQGYTGKMGLPDGLMAEQAAAILYIVRILWLVGGTVRPPYFEIMSNPGNQWLLRSLKRSVLRGSYSLFDFLTTD